MTPEAQRIAIAEACGWEDCKQATEIARVIGKTIIAKNERSEARAKARRDRGFPYWPYEKVPEYLTDLNAMHYAEKVLTENPANSFKLFSDYLVNLDQIVCREHDQPVDDDAWSGRIAFATAAQRAEAFLKTIGKWIE